MRIASTRGVNTAAVGALALICLLACAGCAKPYEFRGTTYEPAKPAPEISGVNWDNNAFRLSDQQGKLALVFFGYTWCPDVCPMTLTEFKTLYRELGDTAAKVAVVFVTVDPERDTPERLGEYVPAFDKRFYGVYMDLVSLEPIKQSLGVIAEKQFYDAKDSAAGYSVDHTARTYLIDQQGNLRLSYSFGTPVEDILADIRHLLK